MRMLWLAALAIALAVRPAHAFDRARPMGLYATTGAPLAMIESRIELTVRGPIIEAVVVQRFRNPGDRATEAVYTFPLPPDAAISAMAIEVGARTIRAAIEPREAAQRRYEAAVAAGVAAAVLDEERPDVFTQSVSAIPPHGIATVTLRYDAVARFAAGSWELVVPMVVAPRFVPGTASGRATTGTGRAPDTDRAPDASRVTPATAPGAGGSTEVAIHFIDEPSEVTSPTHELTGTRRDAALSDPQSDHDAIVRWRAPVASAGWIERDGDAGFAAVVVEAPPPAPRAAAVRLVIALDRAATARGDADTVQRPAVRALLQALGAGDRVRVIGSDSLGWSTPGEALQAIERAWAAPARPFDLTRVLEAARPDGQPIVLVSDGLVADAAAAIAAARRLGVPIHAIGIGSAPARATLGQLAAVTGGTVRFAVAGDDLGALARGALADLASPSAPLTVTWGTLAASEVEPAALPRLGAGQAALVVARIRRVEAANARIRGDVFAFEQLGPARPVEGATTRHGALARRWASDRLADLLASPHDRKAVTELAVGYGLVSPYTSLVAIGSEVVVTGGVKRTVSVPVSLPAGMQWHTVKQAMAPEPAAPPPEPASATVAEPARPAPPAPPRAPSGPSGPPASAPSETPPVTGRSDVVGRGFSTSATGRVIDMEGELASVAARPWLRFAAAAGGGLAFDHGSRGLLVLDARLDIGLDDLRRTRLGGEAALWLVDGIGAEGRALLTIARSQIAHRFELGVGAGAQFGHGSGIAGSLRLGIATPVPGLAGFIRYDAAALISRSPVEAAHAIALGLELAF